MKPYNVATSCEALSSYDSMPLLKEIVFPYKQDLLPPVIGEVPALSVLLDIPAHVLAEIESRRDAAEADRILRAAGPADYVPWEKAKERLGL